ncbi:MAG: hypothetical protein HRT67_09810 [Flavobacteriaceae bacterium]|nr:hypothetical protein [Flavobacteriaceae bacterium]
MNFEQIHRKINEAKRLDFGLIIDEVIRLYKTIWLKGFLIVVVIVIFSAALAFLFSLFGLGIGTDTTFWFKYKGVDFYNIYATQILYSFPQTILISVVSLGMIAGLYRMCKIEEHDKEKNDAFFYFFSGEYISKLFMLAIIYAFIALLSQLLLLPYIYTFVPLAYFAMVFSSHPELTEMEIVKLSFYIGTKKWFLSFALILVTFILGMLGVIACGIGLFFTISIMYLPVYFVYKHVVGFDGDFEINLIGKE